MRLRKTDIIRFSVKGQIVIPKRLRAEFDILVGTRAWVRSTPQGILIKPLTKKSIDRARGKLRGQGVMKQLVESRLQEKKA